jgi:hypothetical protein
MRHRHIMHRQRRDPRYRWHPGIHVRWSWSVLSKLRVLVHVAESGLLPLTSFAGSTSVTWQRGFVGPLTSEARDLGDNACCRYHSCHKWGHGPEGSPAQHHQWGHPADAGVQMIFTVPQLHRPVWRRRRHRSPSLRSHKARQQEPANLFTSRQAIPAASVAVRVGPIIRVYPKLCGFERRCCSCDWRRIPQRHDVGGHRSRSPECRCR